LLGYRRDRIEVKIRTKNVLVCIITSGFLLAPLSQSQGKAQFKFLGFSKEKKSHEVPKGWEGKKTVLMVRSIGSASGVLRRIDIDLKKFPVLVWRWKINRVVGMAIESRKDRNDSAARVRVIFGMAAPKPLKGPPEIVKFFKSFGIQTEGKEPRGFKIDYIWGNNVLKGEVIDYPSSKNHKMVVVESGNKRAGRWVWEKRNLVEDFKAFFRKSPPTLIGIMVLTDTDQTNEGVVAHYSSIIMMDK